MTDQDNNIQINEFNDSAICLKYQNLSLIVLNESGILTLNNVKFINLRMELESIIKSQNIIKLYMRNVDFINIVALRNNYQSAIIKAINCIHIQDSIIDDYCGEIHYNGGLVKLINNGFEIFNINNLLSTGLIYANQL